ncbi:hypothetical protein RvY_01398 [Ramazzottius varieornatus]|uniref:Uncharacterized protein n=1 Tax=Ramazzottius varieornatus TaxID=947166 RepID=A0A1D1UH35_RAMVA|nr:hypothetical protein RvY_01398 [Ramazzottius varieornatus]
MDRNYHGTKLVNNPYTIFQSSRNHLLNRGSGLPNDVKLRTANVSRRIVLFKLSVPDATICTQATRGSSELFCVRATGILVSKLDGNQRPKTIVDNFEVDAYYFTQYSTDVEA